MKSALASVCLAVFIKGVLLQCHNGTNTELKIEPEEGGRRKRRRLSGEKGHSSTSSRHGSVATIRNLLLGVTWRSVLMFAFCMSRKAKREATAAEVRGHREKGSCAYVCVEATVTLRPRGDICGRAHKPRLYMCSVTFRHINNTDHITVYFIYLLSISHRFS